MGRGLPNCYRHLNYRWGVTVDAVRWNGNTISTGPTMAVLDSGGDSIKAPKAAWPTIVKLFHLLQHKGNGANHYINCSYYGAVPIEFVIGGAVYNVYFPQMFNGDECNLPGKLNQMSTFHVIENTKEPDQWYLGWLFHICYCIIHDIGTRSVALAPTWYNPVGYAPDVISMCNGTMVGR